MPKGKNKPAEWENFEHKVEHVLGLAGYDVEHDTIVGGGQTDLIAVNNTGPLITRIIVECKYSEKRRSVSIDDVENFVSRVIVLRTQDLIDSGMLITNTAFSRHAKSIIKHNFIELLTLDELYCRIYNFRPYLTSLIETFERSKLHGVYINPFMLPLDPTINMQSDQTFSTAFDTDITPIDMSKFFSRWVKNKEGGRICLLGDYGSGKTSFCQWYAVQQAKKHLGNPSSEPIPLLIPLNRFTKAIDVNALITDFVVNDCQINNFRLHSFMFLLEYGRFLLILDGFDEMARHVDKEVRYQTISDLSQLAKGRSKLILTGRPGYFPTHDELLHLIVGTEEDDLYSIARDAFNEIVDYEPFEIQPFDLKQITQFVKLYIANHREAEKILNYIHNMYNLLDLASRPVLLEMIVKSLPRLLEKGKTTVVNSAGLYEAYTGLWIDREEQKGEFRKLIRKEDKLRFMQELSLQMFVEDKNAINYRNLNPTICEFFGVQDTDLDYFAHDIRTCSFLFRIPRDGYTFVHRSFQEYFIAQRLISDIIRDDIYSWGIRHLPNEILRFTSEILFNKNKTALERMIELAMNDPFSITSLNAATVVLLSETTVPDGIEKMFGMPGRLLRSYAALKLDRVESSKEFLEHLYKYGLEYIFNLRAQEEPGFSEKEDIMHDAFFNTVNILKRKPLMKLEVIRNYFRLMMETTSRDIERAGYRKGDREVGLSDIVEDFRNQGYKIDEQFLASYEEDVTERIEYEQLMDLLEEELSKQEFELLKAYYIVGYSVIELSNKLNVSPNGIRTRLLRLRKKLAAQLLSRINV